MLPVCERGDDETVGAAEELVLVAEVHVRDGHDALVVVLLEVKPRLLQPLEVRRGADVLLHLMSKGTRVILTPLENQKLFAPSAIQKMPLLLPLQAAFGHKGFPAINFHKMIVVLTMSTEFRRSSCFVRHMYAACFRVWKTRK